MSHLVSRSRVGALALAALVAACSSRDVVATSEDVTTCAPGCTCASYSGSRYMFCPEGATWPAADALCVEHGMRIARIDGAEENDWVRQSADAAGMLRLWIGTNDRDQEGVWRWPDGDLVLVEGAAPPAPGYHNFLEDEPNQGGGSDCNSVYESGSWHDQPCDSERGFVCKTLAP